MGKMCSNRLEKNVITISFPITVLLLKLSDYSFITNQTIVVAEMGYNSILRKGLLSFHTHELLAMKQTVQTQFLKVHIHIQKMCT